MIKAKRGHKDGASIQLRISVPMKRTKRAWLLSFSLPVHKDACGHGDIVLHYKPQKSPQKEL